jgi:hypothetical protein
VVTRDGRKGTWTTGFRGHKNVLKLDCCDGCTALQVH